jgi:hypothetical protein
MAIVPAAFLRLMGSLLKSLLQLVQFLAQLGKWLFCWIGFLTCLLGGTEIGLHHSVFLVHASIFGSVRSMHAPMFLAQLAGPLKTDFLGTLLRGSSTGPLGSCLVLVRSFLARLRMDFLPGTHVLNSLERSLKRTHVHGSHALFLQVVLTLPLLQTHRPENMTHQISFGEQNNHRHHAGIVARAVAPAGQLHNVGVELLYVLYKLAYANPLELLEHIGKVVLLLFSCAAWKHSEKVKHNAVVE